MGGTKQKQTKQPGLKKSANLTYHQQMAKWTLQEGMALFVDGLKEARMAGLTVSLNVGTSFYTNELVTLGFSVHGEEDEDGKGG